MYPLGNIEFEPYILYFILSVLLLQTRYVRIEFDDDDEGEISHCLENSSRPQEFVFDDKVLARKVRTGALFPKRDCSLNAKKPPHSKGSFWSLNITTEPQTA